MSEFVRVERQAAIAIVTIDRPKALNALNPQVIEELYNEFDALDKDDSCRVVILTGSGEKSFVAGADIGSMAPMNTVEALEFANNGHRTMDRIAAMKKFTIAAVNGFALGGGLELAMSCDIRIGSTNARMGIPETTLGTIPGFGGTQRLARLVGRGMALEMFATGRQVKADEAKEIGLLNKVVASEELLPACIAMAEGICKKNSGSAIALGKIAINNGYEMDLAKALQMEKELFALTFGTEDRKEGMTAFIEKRPANFK